ncbi:uncharacterized protein AB675_6186 [Cyphellophora attinorum]|uniref:DUF6604 domain-containing protein n=1 Tax=Cyphellophora attinorum TaxID=1664694 RepID=A0A0N0NQH9_9EURO|nr:uncharacterized protein AB675_6186 [Phialophora attinorum]KPI43928.1 hypothetical protein AB675_6186 [Phialophora attinorum]
MLPPIVSSYQQYKHDTAKIATWLFQKSSDCGFVRSKAMRRKASKSSKYEIALKEFVPMAEAIAKSADKFGVKITTGMIKTFKRCIRARSGINEWFIAEDSENDVSNEGHKHCVAVLQEALEVLVPLQKLQEIDESGYKLAKLRSNSEEDTATLQVKNAFGSLMVEELDEAILAAVADATPEPSAKGAVECSLEDNGEDWFFAVQSFFDEIHEMRTLIQALWMGYAAGDIDVATVSVVSNTAVDLANLKPNPTWGDHLVPLEAWDAVEESLLLPYRWLASHIERANGPTGVAITRPAFVGQYDALFDRSKATPKQLYEQDSALLTDMLTTTLPYVLMGTTPNDTELLKGLRTVTEEERSPPTWLAFAAQLYVDAQTSLKTKGTQPCSDLIEFALDARRVLRGHAKFNQKHTLVGYQTPQSELWPETTEEIEQWVLDDQMHKSMNASYSLAAQKRQNKKSKARKVREWQPYEILRMDSTLCGLWKYCFHLQLQTAGLRLVNQTQVMVVAHLYNALKQNDYLPKDCVWQDVEYLLKIHERANTFLGERPKTIEECTKRLALAQGVSPQTFAAGRREGARARPVFSKSGGKILQRSTPIAEVFVERFLEDGSTDLSLANIETVLTKRGSSAATGEVSGGGLISPNTDDDQEGSEDDADDIHDSTLMQWNDTRTVPSVGFLEELAAALQAEHLDLQFDYFSFHRQTRSLLEQIHTACYDYGKDWIKEEFWEAMAGPEGAMMMPGVIMLAASSPAKSQNLYALKDVAVVDTRGLKAAAVVMKEFIEREGAAYSEKELSQLDLRQKMGEREHGDDWDTDVATLMANLGLTGSVGRVDGMTKQESARELKAWTVEKAAAKWNSLSESEKAAQTCRPKERVPSISTTTAT